MRALGIGRLILLTGDRAAAAREVGDALGMDEVVAEVSLYSPRPIVLGDSDLGKLRFTGTVSQAHLDDWLAALEAVFSVRIIDQIGRAHV